MDEKIGMISIIICSRKADISEELKQNIAETIGCDYELCVVDNSHNEYSIFSAYNNGAQKAKGNALCFMHEDVLFRSEGWGKKIEEVFVKDEKLGAVGVVGGQYLSKVPVPWWESSAKVGGLIQGYQDKEGKYRVVDQRDNEVKIPIEVVALDGVFICARASLFENIKWDEDTYQGYHLYDMDICMQVLSKGYKIQVLPDIILEHFSDGSDDKVYYETLEIFAKKWEDKLPIYRGIELSLAEVKWRENMLTSVYTNRKKAEQGMLVYQSTAYRLGKIILKPFEIVKKRK